MADAAPKARTFRKFTYRVNAMQSPMQSRNVASASFMCVVEVSAGIKLRFNWCRGWTWTSCWTWAATSWWSSSTPALADASSVAWRGECAWAEHGRGEHKTCWPALGAWGPQPNNQQHQSHTAWDSHTAAAASSSQQQQQSTMHHAHSQEKALLSPAQNWRLLLLFIPLQKAFGAHQEVAQG